MAHRGRIELLRNIHILPIAGGILGPHVETARGLIGASSLLVRIHERVHPVISTQFDEKKIPSRLNSTII